MTPPLEGLQHSSLERWTFDPVRGGVWTTKLDDRPQKFPHVHEALVSRRHRYAYTAAVDRTLAYLTAAAPPRPRLRQPPDQARPVPRHHTGPPAATGRRRGGSRLRPLGGARAEDDGYEIAYVHNPDRGAADLVILAAHRTSRASRSPGSNGRAGCRSASTGVGFRTREGPRCAMVDPCMPRTSSSTRTAASRKRSTPSSTGWPRTTSMPAPLPTPTPSHG
ncbi:carotenoid oxygenase family protein [Streptomyces sp. SD15]